jgi:hypothetical protein
LEKPDALWNAVLVNLKVLLAQIGHEPAFSVAHRGLQQHKVNVHRDPVSSLVLTAACRRNLIWSVAPQSNQENDQKSARPCNHVLSYPQ